MYVCVSACLSFVSAFQKKKKNLNERYMGNSFSKPLNLTTHFILINIVQQKKKTFDIFEEKQQYTGSNYGVLYLKKRRLLGFRDSK